MNYYLQTFILIFINTEYMKALALNLNFRKLKSISFDLTGTIFIHKEPIVETYAEAAVWAKLKNSPTPEELKPAFKQAFKENSLNNAYFSTSQDSSSSREWWKDTIKRTLELCDRNYSEADFNRYFRRIYQHFGSPNGYEILPDALDFLNFLSKEYPDICLGITSNTPLRSIETVLPMLGLHKRFKYFVSCQEVRAEKPSREIFEETYQQATYWCDNNLKKDELLHIGDNLAADFCGAKAFGFQALLLDRSENPRVNVYQDWLKAPDYSNKSVQDIENSTVKNFLDIKKCFL